MRRRQPPIEHPNARRSGQSERRATPLTAAALTIALTLTLAVTIIGTPGCDRDKTAEQSENKNNNNNNNNNTKNALNPPAPPRAPTTEELALLAPLTKGSSLAGWEIIRIEGTDRGALRVVCAQKRSLVRLYVALASDDGPAPPAAAGKFAVFYSLKDASAQDGERLATELAAILEKNKDAPPPPGMTPFQPRPPEPISL